MDHGIDLVLRKDFLQTFLIQDVGLVKLRLPAGDCLNTVKHCLAGVVQIVEYNNVIACLNQSRNGMASDIAGSAGYKNRFHIHLSPFTFLSVWKYHSMLQTASVISAMPSILPSGQSSLYRSASSRRLPHRV